MLNCLKNEDAVILLNDFIDIYNLIVFINNIANEIINNRIQKEN